MNDDLKFWLIVALIIVSVILAVYVINYNFEKKVCKEQSELMGLDWTYNLWIPCMVKVDGKYIDIDSYRAIEEYNKILKEGTSVKVGDRVTYPDYMK